MPSSTATPLRLSLIARHGLSEGERRAVAALLGRSGIPVRVVSPTEAEVIVGYGSAAAGTFLTMHRAADVHPRIPAATSVLEAVTRGERPAWEHVDLPKAALALLEGADESEGPLDEHGRFPPEGSLAVQCGALGKPAVDIAARAFGARLLGLARPGQSLPPPGWYLCLTFDIDSAGMFLGRSSIRHLREIARTCPRALAPAIWTGLRSRLHMTRDPHLRVRELGEMLEGMEAPATFFAQTHRRHRLDNYDLNRGSELASQLRAVLRNGVHEVGLHSSYATSDREEQFLEAQWARLRRVLGRGVTRVHRAHYLRTPRGGNYPGAGVVDSSLGYGSRSGFRRATAWPFAAGGNIELPPAVMDTTLRYHEKLSPAQAFERICQLMSEVRQTGGAFVSIFHPNNMDEFLWPGWRDVVVDLVQEAKSRGAIVQSLARTARQLYAEVERIEKELARQVP